MNENLKVVLIVLAAGGVIVAATWCAAYLALFRHIENCNALRSYMPDAPIRWVGGHFGHCEVQTPCGVWLWVNDTETLLLHLYGGICDE